MQINPEDIIWDEPSQEIDPADIVWDDEIGAEAEEARDTLAKEKNTPQRAVHGKIEGSPVDSASAFAQGVETITDWLRRKFKGGEEKGAEEPQPAPSEKPNIPIGEAAAFAQGVKDTIEEGRGKLLKSSIKTVYPRMAKSIGGLIRAGEESIGLDTGIGEETARFWEDVIRRNEPKGLKPGSFESRMYSAMSSVAQNLPYLAAGVITKNPNIALAGMATQVAGEQYHEVREKGKSPLISALAGLGYGLAEVIGEKIPVGILLKKGYPLLKRIALSTFTDVPGEMVTEAIQAGIDKKTIHPDMTAGEAYERIKEAGLISTIAGPMQAGIVHVPVELTNREISQLEKEISSLPEAHRKNIEDAVKKVLSEGEPPAGAEEYPKTEALKPEKDVNRYRQFIENRIKEGKMEPLVPSQRQKLVETYKEFPLYQEVTTKLGEKVKFTPPENKSPEEYVHHFLTKYSKHRNKELFSGKYLQLIKEIPETIQNHDDRILGEVNGQDRIYYIREFRAGKLPPHLVVVTVDGNGNLIGWTHFETNKAYIKRLEKREKELIEKRGLIDKEGNPVDWGYDEYLKNKRMYVLYLGSTPGPVLRQPQEPPHGTFKNIPQSPEEVKGSAEESVVSDVLSRESGEEGYILIPGSVSFKKFWTAFKEFWQPLSTMPESEKYLALRYKAYGDIDRIENLVKSLWEKTKKLSPEVKRKMFLYLDGKISKEELPHEARLLANSIRERLKTIGRMLVKRGLLSEETFEKHKGTYVRYLYLKHLIPDADVAVGKGGRLDLSYLKRRKDLTAEQRRALGLIEDVSVAVPVGMSQSLSDIAKFDFFAKVAENPNWVWQPSIVEVTDTDGKTRRMGIGKLVEEVEITRQMHERAPNVPEIKQRLERLEDALERAREDAGQPPEEFVQVPTSKSYGPLAGAFVRKEIWNDIKPVYSGMQDGGATSRLINTILKVEQKGMAAFKVGKVALNPPTMFRNIVSNIIQLNLSGIPLYEVPRWMVRAAKSMKAGDRFYTLARRNGIFKTNFSQAEIGEVLNIVQGMDGSSFASIVEGAKKLIKFYGKIDDFFKLTKFIEQMEKGRSGVQATLEAQKWVMDYSRVHPSIKLARRHIMPFVTYSYKVAPLIVEAIMKRPHVILKYLALPYIMMEIAKATLDFDDDDVEKLKKQLSLFIRESQYWGMGQFILNPFVILPWKSPEGNVQWINLEYFFPWQSFFKVIRDVATGEFGELTRDIGIGNPFLSMLYAAMSAKRGEPPKDPFTGMPIWNELDDPNEKVWKFTEWLWNLWAPSAFTAFGALGYTKRAIEEKPDYYGRITTPGQAAARWFGFNVLSPTQEQIKSRYHIRKKELKLAWRRIKRDPTISEEEKKRKKKKLDEELKKLKERLP